jgi:hypothetical protein
LEEVKRICDEGRVMISRKRWSEKVTSVGRNEVAHATSLRCDGSGIKSNGVRSNRITNKFVTTSNAVMSNGMMEYWNKKAESQMSNVKSQVT